MYATLSQLKGYLKIGPTITDDVLLNDTLSRAQSVIERITGKVYEAATDTTRRFDAVRDVDGRLLLFDNAYIAQFTTVMNGDGVAVAASDYVTEPRNSGPYYGIRLKDDANVVWTFSSSPQDAISITGRWAFSTAAPDYIVQATIRLAAWLYRQKDNATGDADRPLLTGDGVTIMPQALPADVLRLIEMDIPRGR